MKLLIAGASGFIGGHLCSRLKSCGHEIVGLSRSPEPIENTDRTAVWDGKSLGDWVEELETTDGLVNLAGRSVNCKWTDENRKAIYDSRVGTTSLLAEACRLVSVPPTVWVNASGINYYPANVEEALDESGPRGKGFLTEVVADWEAAMFEAELPDCRRVAMRTAIVFGPGSEAYDVFVKLTKFFLGGQIGNGRQWMSWVHVDDLVRIYEKALTDPHLEGPVNASAPEPLRNRDFMAAFRDSLHRPWCPPAPPFLLRLVGALFGPDPSLALDGYRIVSAKLPEAGFEFHHVTLRETLTALRRDL